MLYEPAVLAIIATLPIATLLFPVFRHNDRYPKATLLPPPLEKSIGSFPIAILLLPVAFKSNGLYPKATLPQPVVLEVKAERPTAVF
jgi:hypothetical protein